MKPLTIGRVATAAGVGVETVRFYQRQGLLERPPSRKTGYRQYPQEAVLRIRFIRRAKTLGFSLAQIRELLDLRVDPTTTCSDIKKRAEAKIEQVQARIEDLQKIKQALAHLTAACQQGTPISQCPILEALGNKDGTDDES